jgi:hypothetical protein
MITMGVGINGNLIPPVKGEIRNPGGKPKGTKHINTWVQEILEDENFEAYIADPREGYKLFKGAPLKAIVKAQVIKAVAGDTKAYDSLVKSGYSQKIEQEMSGDMTITINTRGAGSHAVQPDDSLVIDATPDDD